MGRDSLHPEKQRQPFAAEGALGFRHLIKVSEDGPGSRLYHTFVAECPVVGCVRAVTGIPVVFLDAFASILTVGPVAGAVA